MIKHIHMYMCMCTCHAHVHVHVMCTFMCLIIYLYITHTHGIKYTYMYVYSTCTCTHIHTHTDPSSSISFTSAIISILLNQRCTKVMVGDPHQQIYSFKGACNAFTSVQATRTYCLSEVSAYYWKCKSYSQLIIALCV